MLWHSVKLYQVMFGIAPKGFDTVDMLHTSNKLIVAVMHSEMFRKTHADQSIAPPAVGIDHTLDHDTASDNLLQRCFGSIRNDFVINLGLYLKLRRSLADEYERHTPDIVELDESYFGSKSIRDKRRRGAGGKTIVSASSNEETLMLLILIPVSLAVSEAVKSKAKSRRI